MLVVFETLSSHLFSWMMVTFLPLFLKWLEGGHATEDVVRFGLAGEDDPFGNQMADEAAGLGRRTVDPVVIDARRNLSGVLW